MCPRTSLANENNGEETYCKAKRNDKDENEKMLSQRGARYGILKKGHVFQLASDRLSDFVRATAF